MLYKDAISNVIFVIVQICDKVITDHIVPMIETFVLVCAWSGRAYIVDISLYIDSNINWLNRYLDNFVSTLYFRLRV